MGAEVINLPLSKGYTALIDKIDEDIVCQFKWSALETGNLVYGFRQYKTASGKWTSLLLHRFILKASAGTIVDHVDRNGLNNTRANLRITDTRGNARNSSKRCHNTSGYIGVSWNKQKNKWHARYFLDGSSRHVGFFHDPVEAALARDAAVRRMYGDFAVLNFEE